MKRLILGALLFLGVVVLAACSDSDEELTPVTVMLDWTPNTNHMGIFVANEQGWYEDADLDVTIIEPTGGVEAIVAEGQASSAFPTRRPCCRRASPASVSLPSRRSCRTTSPA